MDDDSMIMIKVANLPTLVDLSILNKTKIETQRVIWIEDTLTKVVGSIESPKSIIISPDFKQQVITDQITGHITKNKKLNGDLAFTEPHLIHLANNVYFYDNSYLNSIVGNIPADLNNFWAVNYLKQFLADYVNIGYNPKNSQLLYLTAVNRENKREKIEFQGEKYTLLEFTASACEPCLRDIDKLVDFNEKHNKSVDIVMIWQDKNYDLWMNVAKKQKVKITWESYLDENMAIFKSMNIKGWPTYMLIDKDGMIVKKLKNPSLDDIEEYLVSH